jgi:hypothetical protein
MVSNSELFQQQALENGAREANSRRVYKVTVVLGK